MPSISTTFGCGSFNLKTRTICGKTPSVDCVIERGNASFSVRDHVYLCIDHINALPASYRVVEPEALAK